MCGMSERVSYKVLDIGIGFGGEYVKSDSPNVIRIGIDVSSQWLSRAETNHPDLSLIQATGENLPLSDNSVDEIQMLFPYGNLLHNGLQNWKLDESWYKEFSRVLKTKGTIRIIGDQLIVSSRIRASSTPYFSYEETPNINAEVLRAFGTATSIMTALRIENREADVKTIGVTLRKLEK